MTLLLALLHLLGQGKLHLYHSYQYRVKRALVILSVAVLTFNLSRGLISQKTKNICVGVQRLYLSEPLRLPLCSLRDSLLLVRLRYHIMDQNLEELLN